MTNFISDIKKHIVEEIHKPARINFNRRHVIIKGLFDLYQADLCEIGPYAKENDGYRYILVVINCFSKYLWAYPLKTKTGREVAEVMKKIFENSSTPPKHLQSDQGSEFLSKEVQKLLKQYKIKHYFTYSEKKASIVERAIRTFKSMLWKELNIIGSYKWYNLLPDIVYKYNNNKHRTIGMKPSEVTKKHEKQLLQTVYSHIKLAYKPKFRIGEHVRISKIRGVFDKKYQSNWSTEIFVIKKVQLTNPTTYLLQDVNSHDIKGGFYEQQLEKVKYPDAYLVEKVLKRKRGKIFVKWLGFPSQFNSWVPKDNVL